MKNLAFSVGGILILVGVSLASPADRNLPKGIDTA